jgi:UDP-N-acetylmuramoylalanine--D-glutamate ligase
MIDFVKNKITGKLLLILGFGREGESTYNFLTKHFSEINLTIADKDETIPLKINDSKVRLITGENYLESINDFDIIFKTPGISLNHLPFEVKREKITSQTDLFLEFYSRQIIGITGTKGKSTTSSLIYHIFKLFTVDAILVGNIGVPPFDVIDDIGENTRIVFELSSHQLEFISKGPKTAILLNLFQEHLDHYKSFEEYQQAKFNILRYQDLSGNFIFNADDNLIDILIQQNNLQRNYYGCSLNMSNECGCHLENENVCFIDMLGCKTFFILDEDRHLKGDHNIRNIMAAICACKLANIPNEIIAEGIKSFPGLEHRIEYVGEFNNVHYYNDSISTIPEATIEAIKTLGDVSTLILGGFDRGIDYGLLIDYLESSSIHNLIFLGAAGKRILDGLIRKNIRGKKMEFAENFEDAVKLAKHITAINGICLLSPAAASYDMFKNFEERGRVYKKLVRGH